MIMYCFTLLERLKADRKGVTALEYAVIAAVVVVAAGVFATAAKTPLTGLFNSVTSAL